MKKLLITGVSGLLGLNTALEASKEIDVYGVTNQHSIQSDAFSIISADLTTPDAVQEIYDWAQPDWVLHCAAQANLEVCETDPELAETLNAKLPGRMAQEAAKRGARFVHISTDAVFDGQKGDYSEEDIPNPLNTYARSKLAAEQAVAVAYPEAVIARVVFYGWSLTGHRSLAEFFINNLRDGKRVKGFSDVYFSPLLVNDLAQILLSMLDSKLNGLYHVYSSDAISKYDFGVAVANRFGFDASLISPTSIEAGDLSAVRSPNLTMRTDKLAQALGRPLPTIAAGLDRFWELYQAGYPQKVAAVRESVV